MGNAAKLALAKTLLKGLYRRHGWRNAPDPGNLTSIHVLGWLEVMLLKVSRKIEERHVLSGEQLPAGWFDFREEGMDQVFACILLSARRWRSCLLHVTGSV